eukprot:178933-Hanusia_phi.AAC.1
MLAREVIETYQRDRDASMGTSRRGRALQQDRHVVVIDEDDVLEQQPCYNCENPSPGPYTATRICHDGPADLFRCLARGPRHHACCWQCDVLVPMRRESNDVIRAMHEEMFDTVNSSLHSSVAVAIVRSVELTSTGCRDRS